MAETLPIGTLEATAEPAKRKVPNNILGKDDFMSLMLTQIRHQDPLEPMDNTESIAQLAQFSSLEQMQNMANGIGSVLNAVQSGNKAASLGMIGKYVEAFTITEDENGSAVQENVTGKVRGVDFTTENPTIVVDVNGKILRIPQTQVQGVAELPAQSTQPGSQGASTEETENKLES